MRIFTKSFGLIISLTYWLALSSCQEEGVPEGFFDPDQGGKPEAFQHLFWVLGHLGIWISMVFYISTFLVWGYCTHKVFYKKSGKKRHVIGFVFYLCFFPIWALWMAKKYQFFVTGGY